MLLLWHSWWRQLIAGCQLHHAQRAFVHVFHLLRQLAQFVLLNGHVFHLFRLGRGQVTARWQMGYIRCDQSHAGANRKSRKAGFLKRINPLIEVSCSWSWISLTILLAARLSSLCCLTRCCSGFLYVCLTLG